MHICTRYIHVHMQSICIYPSCIHAYGTYPLFRIKSDSLRKKYKFGIHTRGSDPFVRSYIEQESKRKRKERTAVLGTVAETSQVVAIPDTSSSINTYTYLLYISLPRYIPSQVRYLVIHRRHKITQQKAPKNPKRKEQKKKEKKSHHNPSSPRRRPKGPRFGQG